ncbi:MAG: hypothetical protein JEY96_02905 [Bacteroidales bacterium]|nr:hypothetical protein [Bacteroidales bacterium]
MAFSNEIFWSSSSELEMDIYADFGKYGSTNIADNDPTTCWAEGAESDGSNEFIWLTIPSGTKTLRIRNGYQKSESIYFANNRPRNIELQLFACYDPEGYVTESHNGFFISEKLLNIQAALEDKLGYQDLKINFNWGEIEESLSHDRTFAKDLFILKIKIVDVYKGNKWNDACISDINILPNPYYELTKDEHGLLKVSLNETDTLFYNSEYIYQVLEISPDSEWIIFTLMPSEIEFSRAETIYKLFSAKREKFVEVNELTSMYGFIKESGNYYLEGLNKELNDTTIIIK